MYYLSMNARERFLGSILGLAVGDAVGTTLEFRTPGTFEPITDMVGKGPFDLRKGEWTDDTSMALCLAQSLIDKNGFDPNDQMEAYIRWWRQGYMSHTGTCFDIGMTVQDALSRYENSHEPFSGSDDPLSAGNGSIMRLAPVPLFFSKHPKLALKYSAESSLTTHGAVEAVDACRYMGSLIVGAVTGVGKKELLSEGYSVVGDNWKNQPLAPAINEIAQGSFKHRNPPEIKGTGYVVKSLEAALWAFYNSNNFREGCLLAVNLGDDADTTGAVYGQIAGAFYGYQDIPEDWRTNIAMLSEILNIADHIYEQY